MRRTVLSSCLAVTLGVQSVGLSQTSPAAAPPANAPSANAPSAAGALPPPATMPVVDTEAAKEKAAALAKLLLEVAALPSVTLASPRELVKFEIVNGMVAASTTVKADNQARIAYPGQRGVVIFTPQSYAATPNEPVTRFSFARHDYTLPGAGMSILSVGSGEGRVIVAVDAESERSLWQVQLIQDGPPAEGAPAGDDPVRLLVRQSNLQTNKDDVDVRISAASFVELRRKYPDEMNRYLRPIFRELGQEQFVSGVDVAAGWQVLGGDWKPDDGMRKKVASVVERLGTGDFRERERAQTELAALGQPAAIVLGNMDRTAFQPEQAAGVDTFLSTFRPLDEADARRQADSPAFLIDCLYLDDPTIRRLALARLEKKAGKKLDVDVDADEPARAATAKRLRETLLPPPATQFGL